jgi:hypothetical protein
MEKGGKKKMRPGEGEGKGKGRREAAGEGAGKGKGKGKREAAGEGAGKGKGKGKREAAGEGEGERMSQRARTAHRVSDRLAEIGKGANPEANQARFRLNQFRQSFNIYKSARAQIEDDLEKSRISKSEKTRRMAKARKPVMAAARRVSQFQTIGVTTTVEMQAVADLLKSWNEIGDGDGKPKLTVLLLSEDEQLRYDISEMSVYHKIPLI